MNVESTIIRKWPDLTSVFKKDDPTEIGNYRPLCLLSVHAPSKILESCVADMILASLRDYLSEREQCTVINGDYSLRSKRFLARFV